MRDFLNATALFNRRLGVVYSTTYEVGLKYARENGLGDVKIQPLEGEAKWASDVHADMLERGLTVS